MKVHLYQAISLHGKRYDKGVVTIDDEEKNNWFIKKLIDQKLIVLIQDDVVKSEASDVIKSETVKKGTVEVPGKKSRSKDTDGI